MKKTYLKCVLFTGLFFCNAVFLMAQTSTEHFEDEAGDSFTFTNNGQVFNITSNTGEDYRVSDDCNPCGWDGTNPTAQFIENREDAANGLTNNGSDNGTSMTIATADGSDITVKSFYFACFQLNLGDPVTGVLTIHGKKDGNTVFTITRSTNLNSGTFDNNFYLLMDLSNEGGVDNSNTPIDELEFNGTNDLDWIVLDTFTWEAATASVEDNEFSKSLTYYPNPTEKDVSVNLNKVYEKVSVRVINTLGREVASFSRSATSLINVELRHAPGLYFVEIETEEGRGMVKIIKN